MGNEFIRARRAARVSTTIQHLDLVEGHAVTASGREYKLVGRRGWNLDSDTLRLYWCGRAGIDKGVDVTSRLIEQSAAARPASIESEPRPELRGRTKEMDEFPRRVNGSPNYSFTRISARMGTEREEGED